ncbi:MAG TPA: hybrid sensor histidine kinase/response regulator [Chloroflexi bacterium]|nr:hybrid sensor histidine kinase/response regulator [Chloroflexota bacterium]
MKEKSKILYVEDDPSSEILVRRVLESEGFQVVTASNGLSAIETARNELPDMILMDINISGLDGYEVTTRLRTIDKLKQIPIVAVTAATLSGDRERALTAGCTGYIPKPIDVDRFPEQVIAFLTGTTEEIESAEEKAEYLREYSHRLVDRLEEKIRALEENNIELQRLDRMKTDFIIIAGHELRTPLTTIYGYAQILQTNPELPGSSENPGSPRFLVEKMTEAVWRLNQVVGDILNVSLIDANKLDLSKGPVFLNSLIQQAVEDVNAIGGDRQLIFTLEGLDDLPMVLGDSKRLYQAFWNLITNAVKYTPDGGHITIKGRRIEDAIQIAVQDTGIGIDPEDLDHIFDRFYILHDTALHRSSKTAFKGGGLGVGLAVARGIIEGHGGRIWVESEGHDEEQLPGSIFHILLPIGEL